MTKTQTSIFMGLFTTQAILIAQLSSPRIEDSLANCFPRLHYTLDSLWLYLPINFSSFLVK